MDLMHYYSYDYYTTSRMMERMKVGESSGGGVQGLGPNFWVPFFLVWLEGKGSIGKGLERRGRARER